MTDATKRQAAIAVADRAHDVDDCRLLLAMLGLVDSEPKLKRTAKPKTQGKGHGRGRPPVDHGHGDYRTYIKGCRCDDCRNANRVKCAERRAAWAQDPSVADRVGHGKPSTYRNYGCRCQACVAANTADVNAYRARRRERAALAETGGVQ